MLTSFVFLYDQYMAIRQEQLLENIEFQIYEKNSDVAGTWFENKYRGFPAVFEFPGRDIVNMSLSQPVQHVTSQPIYTLIRLLQRQIGRISELF